MTDRDAIDWSTLVSSNPLAVVFLAEDVFGMTERDDIETGAVLALLYEQAFERGDVPEHVQEAATTAYYRLRARWRPAELLEEALGDVTLSESALWAMGSLVLSLRARVTMLEAAR
jgi:hypothetical protein